MPFTSKPIRKEFTWGVPGRVKDADYFYFGTSPQANASLAIVCGGYEACAPDYNIHRTSYPYWFVKYTLAGKGTLETDKGSYPLTPGTLSGFEPGMSHHYRSHDKDPLVHIFVTLVGRACTDLFTRSNLQTHNVLHVEDPQETQAIFERLLRVGLQKPPHAHEICCHLLHVAVLFHTIANMSFNVILMVPMHTGSTVPFILLALAVLVIGLGLCLWHSGRETVKP